jgi:hypothetical protein
MKYDTHYLISLALMLSTAPLMAQDVSKTCDGKERVGYLGISGIDCDCTISTPGSGHPWSFRSEPKITSLETDSRAGALLKTGDVITAVNGKAITTYEGAQELANVKPGQPVVLTIRRNGTTYKYAITPEGTCPADTRLLGIYAPGRPDGMAPLPSYAVAAPGRTPRAYTLPPTAATTPPSYKLAKPGFNYVPRPWASFGMGLSCNRCTMWFSEGEGTHTMKFTTTPEVYSVEPGGPAARAGIRRGDVITHVNGVEINTEEGSSLFANAMPGDTLRFTVRRGGERKTFAVIGTERTPAPDVAWAQSSEALATARASVGQLQRNQTQQLRRLEQEMRESQRRHEQDLREAQREMLRAEQDHNRTLNQLSSELARAESRMHAAMTDSARAACSVQPPLPPTGAGSPRTRTLRYTGTLGNTEIEVRGANPVSVSETADEVVITTGGTVVRLKKN